METGSNGSLLKVHLGPVQEFITQARSTRDLWSGSYLLSWLMSHGIKALLDQGVDRSKVIYPALEDQPLVDFLGNLSGSIEHRKILTPNLPNILVAKVPKDKGNAIAEAIEEAIRTEWEDISNACWQACLAEKFVQPSQELQFRGQCDRFLSISWQVTEKPISLSRLSLIGAAEAEKAKWESAFGTDPYPFHYALSSWQLDAVRQCRQFDAWKAGGWQADGDQDQNKDTLTGREEAILGGPTWRKDRKLKGLWTILIREKHTNDRLGAITLVKRLWHWRWLKDKHHLKALHGKNEMRFPSTFHIATHDPNGDEDDETTQVSDSEKERLKGYFAVLVVDGDEIGQWVSGAKHSKALSEDDHRDLSQRLTAFALHAVRTVVEEHDGRLIYAGGDDVLALLPADTVLTCAKDLRAAYRGELTQFSSHHLPGGLTDAEENQPEVSAGIAISHFRSPLQDVIRSAQAAEKRAKRALGRAAVAVNLVKRSGEIVEWGCQWQSGGVDLITTLAKGNADGELSSRFPHRMIELMEPYRNPIRFKSSNQPPEEEEEEVSGVTDADGFDSLEAIQAEFSHVLRQQKGPNFTETLQHKAEEGLQHYLGALSERDTSSLHQTRIDAVIGLCKTLAFISTDQKPEKASQPTEAYP